MADAGDAPADDDAELDAAAAELYALPPEEFTAARNARAAASPKALGARIKRLRKPAAAAWAVDLLAREGQLADALELAAALREAQDDLDAGELQRLTRQRRSLVAALAKQAVALARDRGVTVSAATRDDIEKTINAAVMDAGAAAAVATARLIRPLEAAGFEPVDLTEAVGGSIPGAAPAPPAPSRDDLAQRRARKAAEQAVRAAQHDAGEVERQLTRIESRLTTATERAAHLADRVEELSAELKRLKEDAAAAAQEREALREDRDSAKARAREAAQALDRAKAELDSL